MAAQFGVHPTRIRDWKKTLLAAVAALFEGGAESAPTPADAQQAERFEQIRGLRVELDWVKKSCRLPVNGSGGRSSRTTPS